MIEDGPRGLNGLRQDGDGDQDGVEDITLYGVDWDDMDNEVLMDHHHEHNPIQLDNPFSTAPTTLSEVICTPPDCPLLAESIVQLNHRLVQLANVDSRSMLVRRTIWREALHICSQIS